MNIDEIIGKLDEEYGRREWKNHRDPVSELILTILSQHTSDINSRRAFSQLVDDFETWGEVASDPSLSFPRSLVEVSSVPDDEGRSTSVKRNL